MDQTQMNSLVEGWTTQGLKKEPVIAFDSRRTTRKRFRPSAAACGEEAAAAQGTFSAEEPSAPPQHNPDDDGELLTPRLRAIG